MVGTVSGPFFNADRTKVFCPQKVAPKETPLRRKCQGVCTHRELPRRKRGPPPKLSPNLGKKELEGRKNP